MLSWETKATMLVGWLVFFSSCFCVLEMDSRESKWENTKKEGEKTANNVWERNKNKLSKGEK